MIVGQLVTEIYKYNCQMPKVGHSDLLFGQYTPKTQDASTDKV